MQQGLQPRCPRQRPLQALQLPGLARYVLRAAQPQPLTRAAIGWGIGTASALILYASVVWHGSGPGFLPAPACPALSLFYLSALTALLFTLLHMALSVLAFDAYARRVWWRVGYVVLAHLTAAYLVSGARHARPRLTRVTLDPVARGWWQLLRGAVQHSGRGARDRGGAVAHGAERERAAALQEVELTPVSPCKYDSTPALCACSTSVTRDK